MRFVGRHLHPVLFAAGMAAAAPLAAQDGRVAGALVDAATGGRVEGAVVRSTATATPRETVTDSEGRFALCRLPEGDVPLQVAASGYVRLDTILRVEGGETTELRMRVRPGAPGESATIVLDRGRSVPLHRALFIVDGVRVFFSPSGCEDPPPGVPVLDHLEPDHIERIEVVRGPVAVERFGAEAGNGVVLVTTRRGADGAP